MIKKDFKGKVVAFLGPSNSDKTTLIVKIFNIIQNKGFKVCIVKNVQKKRIKVQNLRKNSYNFFYYLLIKGFKGIGISRIYIFKNFLDETYFKAKNTRFFGNTVNKNNILNFD